MPELVAGGPAIPVGLLNELDSGKVVFFCGAGVSMGPGSDLPDFANLVRHVYHAKRIEPDDVEKEALHIGALDKALGLLERDERLGARAVRRTVIERLSEPPSGELPVHKALIDLSLNEEGVRLITTNFDDRFIQAGLDTALADFPRRSCLCRNPTPGRAWSTCTAVLQETRMARTSCSLRRTSVART